MFQNLPIICFWTFPQFSAYYAFQIAFVFVIYFHVKCSFIDICSNPQGVLIQNFENLYTSVE